MSRYTDIADEPVFHTRPSITGYEQLPLVTLEQAIKPVAHLFSGIDSYAGVAKENSSNPADGLTQDESASIYLYTMLCSTGPSLYQVLNQHLRAENRGMLQPWLSYLKLFFTALNKLPARTENVWRCLSDRNFADSYPIGSQLTWWGVSSCRTIQNIFQSKEMMQNQYLKTVFSIECQNAKLITSHSYFKNSGEEEFLLMPGTCFEVINRVHMHEPAEGQLVYLKEIAAVTGRTVAIVITNSVNNPQPSCDSEMRVVLSFLDILYPDGQPINPMLSSNRPHSGAYKPEVNNFFETVVSWHLYNIDIARAFCMMRDPEQVARANWEDLRGMLICFTRQERNGPYAYATAIEYGHVKRILLRVKELVGRE